MRLPHLALLALIAPLPAHAEDVMVFAAASMKTALDAVATDFTAATGDTVTISYAGSNALAQQIIAGAPADIFISASEPWMEAVAAEDLIPEGQSINLLGNTLVLVGAPDAATVDITPALDLAALLDGGKLAMGLVDSVPAGQYGKAALESLGLWDSVAADVAQTDNVRAALALVAAGEAPLGITYATDAVAETGVGVVGTFPTDSHPAIRYPLALLDTAQDAADAAFYDYLQSDAAMAIFAANGFQSLN